jgi:hypothetical protein
MEETIVEVEVEAPEKEEESSFVIEEPEKEEKPDTGAQKRIRQVIKQRNQARDEAQSLRDQNAELAGRLDNMSSVTYNNEVATMDTAESDLDTKLKMTKHVMKKALEDSDHEALMEAQEMLANITADKKILDIRKAGMRKPAESQAPQVQQQPQQFDDDTQEWLKENTWFNEDTAMTAAALAFDKEIRGEGFDMSKEPVKFYKELDRRMREEFAHKFAKPASKANQVVSGGSRVPTSGKTVLDQGEVDMAERLGVSLEDYAKEKRRIEANT